MADTNNRCVLGGALGRGEAGRDGQATRVLVVVAVLEDTRLERQPQRLAELFDQAWDGNRGPVTTPNSTVSAASCVR